MRTGDGNCCFNIIPQIRHFLERESAWAQKQWWPNIERRTLLIQKEWHSRPLTLIPYILEEGRTGRIILIMSCGFILLLLGSDRIWNIEETANILQVPTSGRMLFPITPSSPSVPLVWESFLVCLFSMSLNESNHFTSHPSYCWDFSAPQGLFPLTIIFHVKW